MSVGTNGSGPTTDILGALGISYPDVEPAPEPGDAAMDRRVREIADRARASQPPITTRRLESVEAAPREAKGAPTTEQAGPAPVPSPPPAGEDVRPAVPPPATLAGRRAPRGERQITAAWRREAIVEWIQEQGVATIVEIRDHFSMRDAQTDVARLVADGRLVRTGAKRPSPHHGPPSLELRVPEPGEDLTTSHARTGDAEAEQPAAEAPRGDAADNDRTIEEGHTDEQGDAAADGREAAAPARPPYLAGKPFEIPRYIPDMPEHLLGAAGGEVDESVPSVDDTTYWRHRMQDPDRPNMNGVPRPVPEQEAGPSADEPGGLHRA